ncbi:hypothetical protein C4D60_Mb07t15350 [Musa balbisiana]|uniref:EF-hand domain-containing protein n=1 Tax=Musa balbisiana TaxID=52838 RepID=A0A4S8JHZ1_MUSBA|nr:hypothetical protein C4D60_Mb07t15350 [Musa balbisiana]
MTTWRNHNSRTQFRDRFHVSYAIDRHPAEGKEEREEEIPHLHLLERGVLRRTPPLLRTKPPLPPPQAPLAAPGHDHRSIPFDAVIADVKRRREDLQWERAHFFVVESQILGFLGHWWFKKTCEQSSALKVVGLQLQNDNSTDDKVGWWKEEHFNASDVCGDDHLNFAGFNDLLHSPDASNPKLIHWLSKEEIRERDKDKDGKLNSQEYFNGFLDLIKRYDNVYKFTHESDTSAEAPATKLFSQLDHSNNGYLLLEDELIPVIDDLHLSEHYFAKQQADCGISEVFVD